MAKFDKDGDGKLDYEEFKKMIQKRKKWEYINFYDIEYNQNDYRFFSNIYLSSMFLIKPFKYINLYNIYKIYHTSIYNQPHDI